MRAVVVAGTSSLVLLVAVALAGSMTPGYEHGADTVSRLASPGQPYAWPLRCLLVAHGVVLLAAVRAAPLYPVVRRCLLLAAACTVVAGLASKDPPGGMGSAASQLHVASAVVGGSALFAAMAAVAMTVGHRAALRRASAAGLALSVVLAAGFRLAWGTPVYGALERALLTVWTVWLLVMLGTASQRRGVLRSDAPTGEAESG